ncbi:hypothetical protein D3C87_1002730 [compost metagenome]
MALLGRLAAVAQLVEALENPRLAALGHAGVGVVLVHEGDVVVHVLLLGIHAAHAVAHDGHHLVGKGRVVRDAVRNGPGQDVAVAVFVLQAFAVERGAPRGAAEQEAARTHVAGEPGQVAHALQAEHRVVDVERNHRHVVRAVRGGRDDPAGHRAALVDAFLQHLPVFRLAVVHELVGVLRLVELAERRPDSQLAEHAFHAEGARLVGHDGHHVLADLLVAHQRAEHLHEGHGGGDLALAGIFQQAIEGGQRWNLQRGRLAAALRQVAAQRGTALAQVLHLGAVFSQLDEGHVGQFFVGHRDLEAIAKAAQRVLRHLLGLVRDHLAFARFAHAVALHRLGQDQRGLALVLDGCGIRGEHLLGVVAAAREAPDLVVAHVGD